MGNKFIYAAAALLCCLCSLRAGMFSNDKVGTTGAQFLKIGVGARAIGMGEAYCAVADEVNTLYWNPAGLAQIQSPEITAMHLVWFEDISYDFLAYAQPLSEGILCCGLNYLHTKEIEKYDESGGKCGTFKYYDSAVNIAYALNAGPLMWGATLKVIQENIDDDKMRAAAVDTGVLVQRNSFSFGLVFQNLGPQTNFNDDLPMNIKTGVGYKIKNAVIALDCNAPVDNDPNFHAGVEYSLLKTNKMDMALRTGYKTNTIKDLDALSGLSAGVGVKLLRLKIDYAWVPYSDLGDTHRMSLGIGF